MKKYIVNEHNKEPVIGLFDDVTKSMLTDESEQNVEVNNVIENYFSNYWLLAMNLGYLIKQLWAIHQIKYLLK